MSMSTDYFEALNDIRQEIDSLQSRLYMDEGDHLRLYGSERSAEEIEVELLLLEQKLGFMLRQYVGSKSRISGLISLKDALKNVRSQYGLD